MKSGILHKRYAQALYDIAVEQNQLERVQNDLKLINQVMDENHRELRLPMINPTIPPAKKRRIFRDIFGQHIHPVTLTYFDILFRKGREKEIPGIAAQFEEVYLEHHNQVRVQLTTALPVDEATKQKIAALAAQKTTKTILIEEHTDPTIIGGFKIKIDDYLFDASIDTMLKRLRAKFKKNLYVREF
ncbi:MAG TPA: ATP synthase F1 subunit delta [Bacteroidales bacterium]|nr:ATP synthase F1 subunit delta [Bacteroidales bacterium]